MNIGMLWFDNDPKSDLTVKVERAATYYRDKYGKTPNLCFVHPSMINGEPVKPKEIEIRANQSVLPNHFWIGISTKNGQANA